MNPQILKWPNYCCPVCGSMILTQEGSLFCAKRKCRFITWYTNEKGRGVMKRLLEYCKEKGIDEGRIWPEGKKPAHIADNPLSMSKKREA